MPTLRFWCILLRVVCGVLILEHNRRSTDCSSAAVGGDFTDADIVKSIHAPSDQVAAILLSVCKAYSKKKSTLVVRECK